MKNNRHCKAVWEKPLNTLAQTGTGNYQNDMEKLAIICTGQGSELGNDRAMKGRAKKKMITQKLALCLNDIANKNGNPERTKSFWNTYYCQNRVYSMDGRYYGKFCKNRFCTICSSIRKADIINRYLPIIKTWAGPYFVTLTVKACKLNNLKVILKGMMKAMQQIIAKYRKRNLRGKGIKLIGIKSLECNFNAVKRTYNPHFHLIVANKEIALTIMTEWLMKWTVHYASGSSQHKRPIKNLERDLVETIKYGSKIFTEPDITKKVKGVGNRDIYAAALYNIFEAMKGLRIFERFGFDLPLESSKKATGARVAENYAEWVYIPQFHDWLNTENELTLTGYVPSNELLNLLTYNIRSDVE